MFSLIKWAGVAYLLWLAWNAWNSEAAIGQARGEACDKSPAGCVLAGFAVTMGNPKAMLFYIALLPNLVSAERLSFEIVFPFYLAVIVVLSTVFAVYIFAAETARRAMKSTRAVHNFNRATATALGGAAVWIAGR